MEEEVSLEQAIQRVCQEETVKARDLTVDRVWITDERTAEEAIALLHSIGLTNTTISRLLDCIVARDGITLILGVHPVKKDLVVYTGSQGSEWRHPPQPEEETQEEVD